MATILDSEGSTSSSRRSSQPSDSSQFESPNGAPYDTERQVLALKALEINEIHDEDAILTLPRRKNKSLRTQAVQLAQSTYPELTEIAAIIKYEALVTLAKRAVRQRRRDHAIAAIHPKNNISGKLLKIQGPWAGQTLDPVDLDGPVAIPMPVTIGTAEHFRPIFDFLKNDKSIRDVVTSQGRHGIELLGNTPFLEFERGIVYEDGRLDLCKKVVGPTHIGELMKSLESNHQVNQFLLGNNVISTTGAKCIADFIHKFPDRMETWYLAGCHITHHALSLLVSEMIKSPKITNLWFKRNPFGPDAGEILAKLVIETENLRTLDLETTELGDRGTRNFIDTICLRPTNLRHLYLNANGIGESACAALGRYLADENCALKSLFLATNPIGDAGVRQLSEGFSKNTRLKRLMLASCGINNEGILCLAKAVAQSAMPLQCIDLGVSQTTKAHGQKYNYFDDGCIDGLISLIQRPSMRWLSLGRTMLSEAGLQQIRTCVVQSELVYFEVYRVGISPLPFRTGEPIQEFDGQRTARSCSLALRQALARNQAKYFPHVESYDTFLRSEELRFLRSTPDVRKIDSQYRTLDKRMGLPMDTPWAEGDPTWKLILDDAKIAD